MKFRVLDKKEFTTKDGKTVNIYYYLTDYKDKGIKIQKAFSQKEYNVGDEIEMAFNPMTQKYELV